jgi:hypothetical protein
LVSWIGLQNNKTKTLNKKTYALYLVNLVNYRLAYVFKILQFNFGARVQIELSASIIKTQGKIT